MQDYNYTLGEMLANRVCDGASRRLCALLVGPPNQLEDRAARVAQLGLLLSDLAALQTPAAVGRLLIDAVAMVVTLSRRNTEIANDREARLGPGACGPLLDPHERDYGDAVGVLVDDECDAICGLLRATDNA